MGPATPTAPLKSALSAPPAALGLDLQLYPPPGTFPTRLPHPFHSTWRQSQPAHTGSPHGSPLRFLAPTRARVLEPQILDSTWDAPRLSPALPPGSCSAPLPFLLPSSRVCPPLPPGHRDFPSLPREKLRCRSVGHRPHCLGRAPFSLARSWAPVHQHQGTQMWPKGVRTLLPVPHALLGPCQSPMEM